MKKTLVIATCAILATAFAFTGCNKDKKAGSASNEKQMVLRYAEIQAQDYRCIQV